MYVSKNSVNICQIIKLKILEGCQPKCYHILKHLDYGGLFFFFSVFLYIFHFFPSQPSIFRKRYFVF